MHSKGLKWLFRALFILNICLISFFTFQSQESTSAVSEHVRNIAAQTAAISSDDVSSLWWYNIKNFRQLAHLPEYFALGCTESLALMTAYIKKHRFLLSLFCCFGISLVDQILKWLLPTREFSFFDMLFDFIGYTFGIMLVFGITRLIEKVKS